MADTRAAQARFDEAVQKAARQYVADLDVLYATAAETPPLPPVEPPVASDGSETVDSAIYDIYGPPLFNGKPAHEAELADVHTGYSWARNAITSDALTNGQGVNRWFEAELTPAGADAWDGVGDLQLQVVQWRTWFLVAGVWQGGYRSDRTDSGQWIDARTTTWTKRSDFGITLFGGQLIDLEGLSWPDVSVCHGWNNGLDNGRRIPLPANTYAVHTSALMRLSGTNATLASEARWFIGCVTSDKYDLNPDGTQKAHKYGIGHPREKLLTDSWQAFTCTGLTELAGSRRADPAHIAETLRTHPDWPKNEVPT